MALMKQTEVSYYCGEKYIGKSKFLLDKGDTFIQTTIVNGKLVKRYFLVVDREAENIIINNGMQTFEPDELIRVYVEEKEI